MYVEDGRKLDEENKYKKAWPKKRLLVAIAIILSLLTAFLVSLTVYYSLAVDEISVAKQIGRVFNPPDPDEKPGPSSTPEGNYRHAAVVANGHLCAPIGKDVLAEGGSAVDAAIAALFCEGILNIQSMGLGGGFLMTIYDKATGKGYSLNARETAPAAATEDMFHGDPELSTYGGLSVAVPGELLGYHEAHKRFGRLPWSRLVEPSIKICRDGFIVSSYLAAKLKVKEDIILQEPPLREILIDPLTNHTLKSGDIMRRPKLAETLEIVAREGASALYNGSLTDGFVRDIQNEGGIITREDMENYRVEWQEPVTATVDDTTMYSTPLPGTGVLMSFIMNLADIMLPADTEVVTLHRITEAFKWAYGRRTELGDNSRPGFVPDTEAVNQLIANLTSKKYAEEIRRQITDTETFQDPEHYGAVTSNKPDHGTAHLNVIGPDGDAVSVTSTINLILGSKKVSPSTGILLNDEMDDFSAPNITNAFGLPPSPANFIRPGKRPLSSMVPTIFVDGNGVVQLTAGGAGGSKITTATALVSIANLLYNNSVKEAVDMRRIHHQLFPMEIQYEFGIIADDIAGLQGIGHVTSRLSSPQTSVTALARRNGNVTAAYDWRRGGSYDGI